MNRILIRALISKDGEKYKKAEIIPANTFEEADKIFIKKYTGYTIDSTICSYVENGHIDHPNNNTEKL